MPVEPPHVEPSAVEPSHPDPLTLLVSRLRDVGVEPDPEELADALWLARWVPPDTVADPRPGAADPVHPAEPAPPHPPGGQHRQQPPAVPPAPAPTADRQQRRPAGTVELTVPGADGDRLREGTRPVRVPTAVTFPDAQSLQRALRPLRRFRPGGGSGGGGGARSVLDERATAERTADTGLILPVLRRSRRREARLRLVMDVSTSMVVWEDTFTELREICERSGAFREVRPHFLREGPHGEPAVTATPDGGGPPQSAAQLRDPAGHQVILVLSDCVGPMWRDGGMQRLLHSWALDSPVAVVQPLPQRHWRRTHLPAYEGELRRHEGTAGRMDFRPGRGAAPPPRGALPVPVIAPRPGPLGAWARLVCGGTEQRLRASAGWVRADHPRSTAVRGSDRVVSPRERLRSFIRTASPAAVRLVGHLSAAPLVLPVMRLVQRAMLSGSGPDVLAEVLVGGLVRRARDIEGLHTYAFVDGVQEELLRRSEQSDLHLVLKHCSKYVEQRYGRSVRNFPALAAAHVEGHGPAGAAPLLGPDGVPQDPVLREFARVSAAVIGRFGGDLAVPLVTGATGTDGTVAAPGELLARARVLLRTFEGDGGDWALDDAEELLRHLGADDTFADAVTARIELGDVLLQRWRTSARPGDLLEAYDTVRAHAGRHPVAALTYARVLDAMAEEELRSGPGSAVLPNRVRVEVAQIAAEAPESVRVGSLRRALAALLLLRDEDETLAAAFDRLDRLDRLDRRGAPQDEPMLRTLGVLRAGALRRAAQSAAAVARLAGQGEATVDRAFGEALDRLAEWTDHLVRRLERGTGVKPDLRLLRGLAQLDLARRNAGRGPQPRPPARRDPQARRWSAERAVQDLETALGSGSPISAGQRRSEGHSLGLPRGERPHPPGELSMHWLELAAAYELCDEPEDASPERLGRIRAALDQAALAAESTPQLIRSLTHRALHYAGFGHPYGTPADDRARAVADLDRAVGLGSEDAGLYALRGRLLLGADEAPGTYGYAVRYEASDPQLEDAVRSLRAALDLTVGSDPRASGRHLLFAVALRARFRRGAALSDLHEADWALGVAMREGEDDVVAYAAYHRGQVADALARRTGAHKYRVTAADHYRRCATQAEQLDFATLAAAARVERAGALLATAGPHVARAELRRAAALLNDGPEGDDGPAGDPEGAVDASGLLSRGREEDPEEPEEPEDPEEPEEPEDPEDPEDPEGTVDAGGLRRADLLRRIRRELDALDAAAPAAHRPHRSPDSRP
ncbi:SAV_2336 N-terminal domain-related protein [Streptomyces sp. B-S-A8]|uniref:SAV_2336 N-terminal domain-related protein n=1 Tax=Streptomyces solicavernae TaxID=3043614 RepID=A0ABT6RNH0_9ACTN|nr:SAV_2336 N-terminal domain-related protein [Streptomyces sp. B-S-A8]MDI3385963.1 SAV_2336 N-terminal domain-related protein [Streptomyces sp. B-S-A8]